jgi:D-methionine transport system substrate-binding protein
MLNHRLSPHLLLLSVLLLAGCKHRNANQIRIGITPGPAEEILLAIEPELAQSGVELKIVPFTDYVQPNLALAGHDLDANLYQNVPYLNQFDHDHGTSFTALAKVYVPLMAVYPGKTKSLQALQDGARVSLPNDPVNQSCALHLLASNGLLTLKPGSEGHASLAGVIAGPHRLQLVELDAAQLSRSRQDVDLAVINANFALDAGLNPVTDSLVRESVGSQYANVLVSDSAHASDSNIQKALHEAGLEPFLPSGSTISWPTPAACPARTREKARSLLAETGAAAVAGSAFFRPGRGENLLRFCFGKKDEDLALACESLKRLNSHR